jgi:hypothetical protein
MGPSTIEYVTAALPTIEKEAISIIATIKTASAFLVLMINSSKITVVYTISDAIISQVFSNVNIKNNINCEHFISI